MLILFLLSTVALADEEIHAGYQKSVGKCRGGEEVDANAGLMFYKDKDCEQRCNADDKCTAYHVPKKESANYCSTYTSIGMKGDGRRAFECYTKITDEDAENATPMGWMLKDGCDEDRCSDKQKTKTQEDADACCDYFALDQSIKTKAIMADKQGYNAQKTWADKLAFVLAANESDEPSAEEPACKKEAETCATSSDCCEKDHGDGLKESGVCFDYGIMKGCTLCESHQIGDDCTSDLNGGNCMWKDFKCHFSPCKKESETCESSADCCAHEHEDGHKEPGVCFDFGFMKGCTVCESHNVADDCTHADNGGNCVWMDEKCHWHEDVGDCEMEGMCCPDNYTCQMNAGNTKKACVAENKSEVVAIKCANPCTGILSMMDAKCGQAEDKEECEKMTSSPFSQKKICKYEEAVSEPACKKEAETCESSADCCEHEHEDGHKEPGVCFDFGFSKGCTVCESHQTGDDCTSADNGGNCVWKDGKCHYVETEPTPETCLDDNAGLEGVMGLDTAYDCAMALKDYTESICDNDIFKPFCCATCAKLKGAVTQVEEEKPECTCTGDNSAIPKKATKFANTDYGRRCDAWDLTHRYCNNKRSLAQDNRECWCPLEWCYVPANCKTARKSDFFGDSGLHYSYAACKNDGDQCFDEDMDLTGLVEEDEQQVVEGTTADFHFNSFEGLASKYVADASDFPYCTVASCASFDPEGEPKKNSVAAVMRAGKVSEMNREEMNDGQCGLSMKRDGGRIEHFLNFPAINNKLLMAVVTCYSSFENLGRDDVIKMFGFGSDRRRQLSFDEESYLRFVAKKKEAEVFEMDMLEDLSMA